MINWWLLNYWQKNLNYSKPTPIEIECSFALTGKLFFITRFNWNLLTQLMQYFFDAQILSSKVKGIPFWKIKRFGLFSSCVDMLERCGCNISTMFTWIDSFVFVEFFPYSAFHPLSHKLPFRLDVLFNFSGHILSMFHRSKMINGHRILYALWFHTRNRSRNRFYIILSLFVNKIIRMRMFSMAKESQQLCD